ncbi:M24 family metallopeptidase [Massilia horti]|nr:Xaa-Pro peptidase family protein [Massilia horti]
MDARAGRNERLQHLQTAMGERGMSALVCTRNLNVLLASGFWPVLGAVVAIVTPEPRVLLAVPEDVGELARAGWADLVCPYQAGTLERIGAAPAGLFAVLGKLLEPLVGRGGIIGVEAGTGSLPASYASLQVYGDTLRAWLGASFPHATQAPADDLLAHQRMVPTAWERARIGVSCELAAAAFREGAQQLREKVAETEAVLPFREAFVAHATAHEGVCRADSYFYCMSGPHAARAWASFQQSRPAPVHRHVPILMHCNSYADGYWTDLTRTYVLGKPDPRLAAIFHAVQHASEAARAAIRPGVRGRDVDAAARVVLTNAGYGKYFPHGLGHGVGFSAIDHGEPPRLHPASDDVLEAGMVFNVEPGVYIDGWGGVRDCNMVAVTGDGCELLSPFHLKTEDWCIPI